MSRRAPCSGSAGRRSATWLAGAFLLSQTHGRFIDTFTFGLLQNPVSPSNIIMGFGAWFGTIMLFNVWGLIWPNQKKILGIVPATDEQKAAARKVALYASRINFLLSIPMLMCMVGPSHGLPLLTPSVPVPADLPQQVARALAEDVGAGDLTAALIPADRMGRAAVITREPAIVCGIPYVEASFRAGRSARRSSSGR